MSTKTKPLTKTQADLLTVLRILREHADRTEAEDNKRALGGLTPRECFERGAVLCRDHKVLGTRGTTTVAFANNVKVASFYALELAGLVERSGQFVRATNDHLTQSVADEQTT